MIKLRTWNLIKYKAHIKGIKYSSRIIFNYILLRIKPHLFKTKIGVCPQEIN